MSRSSLLAALCFVIHCKAVAAGPWTYEKGSATCNATSANPCGPANWGKVAGSSGCGTSTSQTPINFDDVHVVENTTITPPQFKYLGGGCSQWAAFTNAYVLEVAFNVAGEAACQNLSVTYNGVNYGLLQMHFHSPSEHTIGNGRFSAEAHMVHKSASGGYLVIGVFLQVDSGDTLSPINNDDKNEYDDGVNRNNKFLNTLWTSSKESATPVQSFVPGGPNLSVEGSGIMNPYVDLTPGRKSMYHYTGGLTTPPCVVPGGVSWWVYDQPVTISTNDISFLRKIVQAKGNSLSNKGDNARPVQPLNGRLVSYIPAVPAKPTAGPTATPTKTKSPTINEGKDDTAVILAGIALAFVGATIIAVLYIAYILFVVNAKPSEPSVDFTPVPAAEPSVDFTPVPTDDKAPADKSSVQFTPVPTDDKAPADKSSIQFTPAPVDDEAPAESVA